MTIEVPQISYFQRIKICLNRMPSFTFFWFLFMYIMGLPFWGDINWNLFLPFLVLYTVLFYVIPRIRMARIYTQKIEAKDGNVVITYYEFNTKKEMQISNNFLTLRDYAGAGPFAIDFFDGKIYKRIFKQYKFGAWAREENIIALEKIIPPAITNKPRTDNSKRVTSRRHPWRDS